MSTNEQEPPRPPESGAAEAPPSSGTPATPAPAPSSSASGKEDVGAGTGSAPAAGNAAAPQTTNVGAPDSGSAAGEAAPPPGAGTRRPEPRAGAGKGPAAPGATPPAGRSGKGLLIGCLVALLVCGAIAFLVVLVMAAMALPGTQTLTRARIEGFEEVEIEAGQSAKKIVVIRVHGIILPSDSGYFNDVTPDAMIRQLRQAADDKNVVAIILDMNSPGGEVIATDEIHHELQQVREQHHLPIITCMRGMGASGGYYLASGTDYIIANRMTWTGSIGVIVASYEYHDLMDKIGVQQRMYKRGELKDVMNPALKRTPERSAAEDKLMQTLVDEVYDEFVNIVAKGRKIPAAQLKASDAGDSRVLSGKQAYDLKLVDQLGYFEDAITVARQKAREPQASVVRYETRLSLLATLLTSRGPQRGAIAEVLPFDVPKLEKGRAYMLCPLAF